jgi:hypothetical protein
MADHHFKFRRQMRALQRRVRELRMIAKGVMSTDHPVMAHISSRSGAAIWRAPTATSTTSYSKPVPKETIMKARIGPVWPTLGPRIRHAFREANRCCIRSWTRSLSRTCAAAVSMAGMITNGYLLTAGARPKRLNRAGLDHLQISVSTTSCRTMCRRKSLKVLDKKLQVLAEHAEFHVNINSVVGGGIRNPGRCAGSGPASDRTGIHLRRWVSFTTATGSFSPIGDRERAVFHEMKAIREKAISRKSIISRMRSRRGVRSDWRCRAGARYMYICEEGLVHYCSQQRGYPAKPLDEYTRVKTSAASTLTEPRACAPYCTVSCVHQVSYIDFWRDPQTITADDRARETATGLVQIEQ